MANGRKKYWRPIVWTLFITLVAYFVFDTLRVKNRELRVARYEETVPKQPVSVEQPPLPPPRMKRKKKVQQPREMRKVHPPEPAHHDNDQGSAVGENHKTLEQAFVSGSSNHIDSGESENAVRDAFDLPVIAKFGSTIESLSCRGTLCRGELVSKNARTDNDTFMRVVMDSDLLDKVPGAFTVASRTTQPDGTVRAVFFLHPDSTLDDVNPNHDDDYTLD